MKPEKVLAVLIDVNCDLGYHVVKSSEIGLNDLAFG